jgi:hypothetical protein
MGASGTSRKQELESHDPGTVILVVAGLLLLAAFMRAPAAISVLIIAAGLTLYFSARKHRSRPTGNITSANEALSAGSGVAAGFGDQLVIERFAPAPSPVLRTGIRPVFPYSARQRFFSRSEGLLYMSLREAFGSRYLIFPNVRLADICADPQDQGALNRIWSKHVDFVLCEPGTFGIIAAIELDGWSHSLPRQIASDQFKDDVFERIGVPLIRYRAESLPNAVELARSVAQVVRVAS